MSLESKWLKLREDCKSGSNAYNSKIFTELDFYFGGVGALLSEVSFAPAAQEIQSAQPVHPKQPKLKKEELILVKEEQPEPTSMPKEASEFARIRKKLESGLSTLPDEESVQTGSEELTCAQKFNFAFLETWNDYFSLIKSMENPLPFELKSLSHLKNYRGGQCKVVFIGDTLEPEKYETDDDLLFKMIRAMKLEADEFVRVHFNEEIDSKDLEQLILQELYLLSPEYIVSMGSSTTNLLLGKIQRLNKVRGKISKLKLTDSETRTFECHLLPIFHPEYLKVNPSMKQNTWDDLQLLMKKLGKLDPT